MALALSSPAQADSGYGKTDTLIPGFEFGPKITALGLPVPFRFGVESKWMKTVGLAFDYGLLPTLTFSNVSVKLNGWNVAARYYIWSQAFFVGLGIGAQTFEGSQTQVISSVSTTITQEFSSTYLAPQIGWRWCWESGLFFGAEIGAQIPISTKSATSTNVPGALSTPEGAALEKEINDQANTFGKNIFPHFALLQVGYFF